MTGHWALGWSRRVFEMRWMRWIGFCWERAGGARVAVLTDRLQADGPGRAERMAAMAVEHFNRLGAQTEAVMALDRVSCATRRWWTKVRAANLVDFFRRGQAGLPAPYVVDTPLWQAVEVLLASRRRG